MTLKQQIAISLLLTFALILAILFASRAHAQEASGTCPAGVPKCKILAVTPDEEKSLAGPNMIFDHAQWANRAGLSDLINAWRSKLANAPEGKVAEPKTPAK